MQEGSALVTSSEPVVCQLQALPQRQEAVVVQAQQVQRVGRTEQAAQQQRSAVVSSRQHVTS